MPSTLKRFYQYTEDELNPKAPKGKYLVRVASTEVGEWPAKDGAKPQLKLDISTIIMDGPHQGKFGPRITLSIGGYTIAAKGDRPAKTVTDDEAGAEFFRTTTAMLNGKPPVIDVDAEDSDTLRQVAKQLVKANFRVNAYIDDKGYMRVGRDGITALDAPEALSKSSKTAPKQAAFNLENV